jgi:competence transcription factor ComK
MDENSEKGTVNFSKDKMEIENNVESFTTQYNRTIFQIRQTLYRIILRLKLMDKSIQN